MLYYKINHVVSCFKDKTIWFIYKYLKRIALNALNLNTEGRAGCHIQKTK